MSQASRGLVHSCSLLQVLGRKSLNRPGRILAPWFTWLRYAGSTQGVRVAFPACFPLPEVSPASVLALKVPSSAYHASACLPLPQVLLTVLLGFPGPAQRVGFFYYPFRVNKVYSPLKLRVTRAGHWGVAVAELHGIRAGTCA